MSVIDLTSMLLALEESTFFLSGAGIVLIIVTYQIGSQRSLATGILFAGLVATGYGGLVNNVSGVPFLFIGIGMLLVSALLLFPLANKQTDRIGGTP